MEIKIAGKLSREYQPHIKVAVEQAIVDMPEKIRSALSGVKVVIAYRMIDILPSMATIVARDVQGRTHDYAHACYTPQLNAIWLAQVVRSENRDGHEAGWDNVYHAFFHETGHAYDVHSCGYGREGRSSSPMFHIAYQKDLEKLAASSPEERGKIYGEFGYYLSSNDFAQGLMPHEAGAKQEVFADAFATILGGPKNCLYHEHYQKHREIFAHCYKAVETMILKTAPDASLYPAHSRIYAHVESISKLAKQFTRTTNAEQNQTKNVDLPTQKMGKHRLEPQRDID